MNYDSITKIGRPTNEDEAQLKADRLAERLEEKTGGQWEGRVWKNLGWCYDAILIDGSMSVKEYQVRGKPPSYRAGLNSDLSTNSGTDAIWSDNNTYDTPEKAVQKQLNKAQRYIQSISAAVQQNEDQLEKIKSTIY